MMNYDYSKAESYAKHIGLEFDITHAENFDQMAKAHGFTQAQVDIAAQHHLWLTAHAWNPKTYPFKQRLKIAGHFIIGKIKGNV